MMFMFHLFKQDDRILADVSSTIDDLLEENEEIDKEHIEEDLCSLPDDWCIENVEVS